MLEVNNLVLTLHLWRNRRAMLVKLTVIDIIMLDYVGSAYTTEK